MLGFKKREDLLALHPADISPTHQPDGELSREKADSIIAFALEKGRHRFEWLRKRSDSSDLLLDILLNAVRIKGEMLIHSVWRDITGQKRVEQALQDSEQRFRFFVENANDIIYAISPEGVFTYVSSNWIDFMGEPAEEAVGRSFRPKELIVITGYVRL